MTPLREQIDNGLDINELNDSEAAELWLCLSDVDRELFNALRHNTNNEVIISDGSIGIGIEQGIAPVGCLKDAEGVITGKVFVCKTTDEEDPSISTIEYFVANTDGTIIRPYTGEWVPCEADCLPLENSGLVTNIADWK